MTPELRQALRELLTDYELEQFVEVFRDDAKQDAAFEGLSHEHPRVRRFQEICRIVRAQAEAEPA